jgi:hypothetical protein
LQGLINKLFIVQADPERGGETRHALLHSLSVNKPDLFWSAIWDFCGVIAEARGDRTVVDILAATYSVVLHQS